MLSKELADLIDRLLSFIKNMSKHRPHVNHVFPAIELHGNYCLARPLCEPD
jgi:hypothetical protein